MTVSLSLSADHAKIGNLWECYFSENPKLKDHLWCEPSGGYS